MGAKEEVESLINPQWEEGGRRISTHEPAAQQSRCCRLVFNDSSLLFLDLGTVSRKPDPHPNTHRGSQSPYSVTAEVAAD